jgi:hypothetical protein
VALNAAKVRAIFVSKAIGSLRLFLPAPGEFMRLGRLSGGYGQG